MFCQVSGHSLGQLSWHKINHLRHGFPMFSYLFKKQAAFFFTGLLPPFLGTGDLSSSVSSKDPVQVPEWIHLLAIWSVPHSPCTVQPRAIHTALPLPCPSVSEAALCQVHAHTTRTSLSLHHQQQPLQSASLRSWRPTFRPWGSFSMLGLHKDEAPLQGICLAASEAVVTLTTQWNILKGSQNAILKYAILA